VNRAERRANKPRGRADALRIVRQAARTLAEQPQFNTGFLATLRTAAPVMAFDAVAALYDEHGEATDGDAMRAIAAICEMQRLTWVDIDGN